MYKSTFTRKLNTLFNFNEFYKKYSVIAAVLQKPTVGKVIEIKVKNNLVNNYLLYLVVKIR